MITTVVKHINQDLQCRHMQELLDELRKLTGHDFQIERFETFKRRWFRKPIKEVKYTLFLYIGGYLPCQVIIPFPDASPFENNESVILSYLTGAIDALKLNAKSR